MLQTSKHCNFALKHLEYKKYMEMRRLIALWHKEASRQSATTLLQRRSENLGILLMGNFMAMSSQRRSGNSCPQERSKDFTIARTWKNLREKWMTSLQTGLRRQIQSS